jgi:hypothetical protein
VGSLVFQVKKLPTARKYTQGRQGVLLLPDSWLVDGEERFEYVDCFKWLLETFIGGMEGRVYVIRPQHDLSRCDLMVKSGHVRKMNFNTFESTSSEKKKEKNGFDGIQSF